MKYIVFDKREEKGYVILAIDFEIKRIRDNKLVVVPRKNLYRIKREKIPANSGQVLSQSLTLTRCSRDAFIHNIPYYSLHVSELL